MFTSTPITEEKGTRIPENGEKNPNGRCRNSTYIQELMHKHPEALLYGQDVGGKNWGVFKAVTLQNLGIKSFFNTAIQEAYIIGSTVE